MFNSTFGCFAMNDNFALFLTVGGDSKKSRPRWAGINRDRWTPIGT